ncbi:hypothetical protein ACLOJK_026444 [Asimina triloba]
MEANAISRVGFIAHLLQARLAVGRFGIGVDGRQMTEESSGPETVHQRLDRFDAKDSAILLCRV